MSQCNSYILLQYTFWRDVAAETSTARIVLMVYLPGSEVTELHDTVLPYCHMSFLVFPPSLTALHIIMLNHACSNILHFHNHNSLHRVMYTVNTWITVWTCILKARKGNRLYDYLHEAENVNGKIYSEYDCTDLLYRQPIWRYVLGFSWRPGKEMKRGILSHAGSCQVSNAYQETKIYVGNGCVLKL